MFVQKELPMSDVPLIHVANKFEVHQSLLDHFLDLLLVHLRIVQTDIEE